MVIFSGSIAGFFWYQGAVLILPFTLLELMVLGVALYIYARHATDYERIEFNAHDFLIERQNATKIERWCWHTPWVRIDAPLAARQQSPELIVLSYKGEAVACGQFLRSEQRVQVAHELKSAMRESLI
jgi:uncharacterized membrane protein